MLLLINKVLIIYSQPRVILVDFEKHIEHNI